MKKNERLIGVCVDYTHEGLGIVKANEFTFFVKNVIVGEEIAFVITKLNKRYGYGKCTEILKPSKARVQPFCEYYGKCGGCQLQHMSYEEQLRFKKQLVQNNLRNIGGLEVEVLDTLASKELQAYRNKAQFPMRLDHGNVAMGFYRIHSNDIIDMKRCAIQSDLINEIMNATRNFLQVHTFDDVFRHLLIKHAFYSDEVMVVFIAKQSEIKGLSLLVESLVNAFPQIKSVVLNVNQRKDNVILGDEEHLLYGKETIVDSLDDLQFMIVSKSFYQVNPIQTKVLYETALSFANIDTQDRVIDLYCGVGTISLFLARKAKQVIGIEIVDAAIANAKQNAKMNGIHNVEFVCSDAASYANKLAKEQCEVDVVLVDPPRKGCDQLTLDSICVMNPKRIVYVSCNPATLARDLKYLVEQGYVCCKVQPCDMFPNSFHVECVVLMSNVQK
ncbi:MAG: 23S rRNA (uracil(1939)-C(5))-methyltransferase RlmD [Erysipelotrichia bacterium]|nr:23S rRNA (uracil(1939)-C(5))-methyltransferase RlmD [Erysipelotrichia bacterium]